MIFLIFTHNSYKDYSKDVKIPICKNPSNTRRIIITTDATHRKTKVIKPGVVFSVLPRTTCFLRNTTVLLLLLRLLLFDRNISGITAAFFFIFSRAFLVRNGIRSFAFLIRLVQELPVGHAGAATGWLGQTFRRTVALWSLTVVLEAVSFLAVASCVKNRSTQFPGLGGRHRAEGTVCDGGSGFAVGWAFGGAFGGAYGISGCRTFRRTRRYRCSVVVFGRFWFWFDSVTYLEGYGIGGESLTARLTDVGDDCDVPSYPVMHLTL